LGAEQGRDYEVVVAGAGILGLAAAYHILRVDRSLKLLVVERLKGPGRGNTAKSAAAYRDMFTSPLNRQLSQGSIAFYEELQKGGFNLGLADIGYLWLLTAAQARARRLALEGMARAGVPLETLERGQLSRRLPGFEAGDITLGVLGRRCGILNQGRLCSFYEQEVGRLGGRFAYGAEVNGLMANQGVIRGVRVGAEQITAGLVVVATGAWMGATLALAGLSAPVVPVKRQLFSVAARDGMLARLLHAGGFNRQGLLPFTILPGRAYLRPAGSSFILGYADEDRVPGLEDNPAAELDFFTSRILPQAAQYFPAFGGTIPAYAWAGHYACHPPDNIPFVDRLAGAILVGGDSGSGIMKGDALGRVAAGLYWGCEQVELGDGRPFKVADLGLKDRSPSPEEFVI